MFLIDEPSTAILFCIITMLGWGSWANTQKMAGKEKWPFELYYWDYALGVLVLAIVLFFTLGQSGARGMVGTQNLAQASGAALAKAFLSGVLFNISNILLVVAIDAAGMSVAFPVGVGLALVIGTIGSYLQQPKGNSLLLLAGVILVIFAMIMSAVAHSKLPGVPGRKRSRGVIFAVVAGCLMGLFYPQLASSISPGFVSQPIVTGMLTPYTALLLFAAGVVSSNFFVNTIFIRAGGHTYGAYFTGSLRLHALGMVGGIIWMLALSSNVIAAGVAGPAVSYALGQGATLVAAIWGVFVWKEFRSAPAGTLVYIVLMFAGYAVGLTLIGAATL